MTQYLWLNSTGDWANPSNWSPTGVPGSGDQALVFSTSVFTLVISAESEAAMDLLFDDSAATLDIASSGMLSIGSTFYFAAGTLDLSGILNGGTVVASGGKLVSGLALGNLGGTLDNVSWEGTVDLSADNSFLSIENGLTLASLTNPTGPGVLDLTGNGSQLTVLNNSTIAGGTLDFGATSTTAYLTLQSLASQPVTLTLASSLLFDESAPAAQIRFATGGSGIVNDGTFVVRQNGDSLTFAVSSGDFFTNSGTVNVENGATLSFNPPGGGVVALTNISGSTITGGTFDVFSNSTLELPSGASITTDNSDITLSGAGSDIQSLIGGTETPLDSTLTGITSTGALRLLSGRSYVGVASGLSDAGLLQMGGGTFTGGAITVTNGASLFGYGVITTSLTNNGIVYATGGVLTLNLGVSGTGSLEIDPTGTLDINAATSQGVTFNPPTSGVGGDFRIETANEYTGTITGLTMGDTIDVGNLIISSASINTTNNTLVANIQGGGSITYQLSAGSYTGYQVSTSSDSRNGTNLIISCFAEGTLIATASGDVAVESLREGDLVRTADGVDLPILWMAHRVLDPRSFANPRRAQPVRIEAGAFGDGMPQRALRLSPEHAVFVDGVFVPVRHLINGRSIVQEDVGRVSYFHVALGTHAVLLAERLPAESWRDDGAARGFENGVGPALLALLPRRASATVVEHGPSLEMLRRRLDWRAEQIGFPRRSVLDMRIGAAGSTSIRIPAGTDEVRLRAAGFRVAGDRRALGAAIAGITLDGVPIRLDDARLLRGFHELEAGDTTTWRWTEPEATIAVRADSDQLLVVEAHSVAARAA